MAKPSLQSIKPRRRPISGPALLVLALVLAGIWYGSRALGQTATVSVDTKPMTAAASPTPSAAPPTSSAPASSPAPVAPTPTPAPAPVKPASSTGLPAGWPSAIPAPTGGTLIKATASGKEGDKSFVASYHLSGSPADVSKAYQEQLTKAGFTVHAVLGSADSAFFGAEKDAVSLSVSVGADSSASGTSNLTITTGQ